MNPLYIVIIIGLITSITAMILRNKASKADSDPANIESDRNEEKKAVSLCDEGESVKIVCRGNGKDIYYILTDKRLIIDKHKGMSSIRLDMIERVRFYKTGGDKAKQSSDCFYFKVYVFEDKTYTFYRYSEKFEQLCDYFFSNY